MEHRLLSQGVVEYDERGELIQIIRKKDLQEVNPEEAIDIIKKWRDSQKEYTETGEMHVVGNRQLGKSFECPKCHGTDYHVEHGCPDPVCSNCGWSEGKCD